ncbi:hypothetical protein K437DRAFT_170455 [Tilletiaria anomala UBC 951]|uniref:Uncharacterized protein n=1 Tax=Tilletiaria anomala (strain ATCC 24038 / CBS 436.72 / UBC 951) TaxID=1037660 RepID=A0A066VJZ7_TILAU|nr:uncharacterized protein K437DRAFT_170455 [Tilletiaria anomala UBC 951]KDN41786.1 hypothetical protein K437DRAFT_170455 [Tilletiaria anomala UBC 951]
MTRAVSQQRTFSLLLGLVSFPGSHKRVEKLQNTNLCAVSPRQLFEGSEVFGRSDARVTAFRRPTLPRGLVLPTGAKGERALVVRISVRLAICRLAVALTAHALFVLVDAGHPSRGSGHSLSCVEVRWGKSTHATVWYEGRDN